MDFIINARTLFGTVQLFQTISLVHIQAEDFRTCPIFIRNMNILIRIQLNVFRSSKKRIRRTNIFFQHAYISRDLFERSLACIRVRGSVTEDKDCSTDSEVRGNWT